MLACSASAAPHVARALMSNGRMAATGLEIATIADRLRRGKTDPKTCPGVEGFTENDWAQLDQVLANVQKPATKKSWPSDPSSPFAGAEDPEHSPRRPSHPRPQPRASEETKPR